MVRQLPCAPQTVGDTERTIVDYEAVLKLDSSEEAVAKRIRDLPRK